MTLGELGDIAAMAENEGVDRDAVNVRVRQAMAILTCLLGSQYIPHDIVISRVLLATKLDIIRDVDLWIQDYNERLNGSIGERLEIVEDPLGDHLPGLVQKFIKIKEKIKEFERLLHRAGRPLVVGAGNYKGASKKRPPGAHDFAAFFHQQTRKNLAANLGISEDLAQALLHHCSSRL